MVPNALTVDVEEYFQVEALSRVVDRAEWPRLESRVVYNTERVLARFAAERVRGTFFTLGWVAREQPALIRRIVAAGHELASHGDAHEMITKMTREEFRRDIRAAKARLEDVSGVEVKGYRAPTFSVVTSTLWALDELREAGYRYDASVYPIRHDRYGIPDARRTPHRIDAGEGAGLVEFPGTTVRLGSVNLPAGGGGYLRLLPLAFNLWALRRAAAEGPFEVYFHPWELDANQPRFGLPRLQSLRAYAGLGRMESRLQEVIRAFPFAPMHEVLVGMGLLHDGATTTEADAVARSSSAARKTENGAVVAG